MNNKTPKLRPPTDEELREMIRGILQENRDHPIPRVTRPKCNDCIHRIPKTLSCDLLYPRGIPTEIAINEKTCEKFEQK